MEVQLASKQAIDAVEKAGGRIKTVYYSRLSLRALLKPHKFDILPRNPRPPPKLMKYYTNYENRGYLSAEIQLEDVKERLRQEQQLVE